MSVTAALLGYLLTPWTPVTLAVLYFVLPYFTTYGYLRDIPTPSPVAAFSNFWLMLQARKGKRFLSVHKAHIKLGPMVRIAPNHTSIADDAAINAIYGHGNGFLKSNYYDAFVSITRGLFNTRDRAEHTRKRKAIAHTFSTKSIAQFEQYMTSNLSLFAEQWDKLSQQAKGGFYKLDALHWFNFLAFDIIGDLAFGQPFGMVEKGADDAEVQLKPNGPITHAPAVEVLNRRGEVNGTLGCAPALKPYAKYFPDPFFYQGLEAVEKLAGMAVARVSARLEAGNKEGRVDLLARLMEGTDAKGNKLGREELTAEA